MAKKRVTLPKEFKDLMDEGNIEALKAVYDRCELTAHDGRFSLCTPLHMGGVPDELVIWLIEQGLDINYQHLVMTWLKRLSSSRGIIMAMHDLNLALNYADTVTCMKRGTLTEVKVPAAEVTEKMLSDTFSREMKIIHYEGNIIALS